MKKGAWVILGVIIAILIFISLWVWFNLHSYPLHIREILDKIDSDKCGADNCEACNETLCELYFDDCEIRFQGYFCGPDCRAAINHCVNKSNESLS